MQTVFVRARYVLMLTVVLLLFSLQSESATLSSETAAAWNHFVQKTNADVQRRAEHGQNFLWTFEDAKRAARVRGGEIVVGRVGEKDASKVPGGLIHHWTGAMFLPNVRMDDVVEVTRDYNRYKEFYRPSVIDSKLMEHTASEDKFSMLLMNKALFLSTALEAEYEVTNVKVDERRYYSVTKSTKIQEIKDFGDATEQRIPEGEGSGYIWKMYSVVRFEQRDGGVYVEVEVSALSRPIPAALRFIAEPIVRSVSRNSLMISLQQTQQAVRGVVASNRPMPLPSGSAGFVAGH